MLPRYFVGKCGRVIEGRDKGEKGIKLGILRDKTMDDNLLIYIHIFYPTNKSTQSF